MVRLSRVHGCLGMFPTLVVGQGAAGTIAFVDPRRKVRATGMIQYMPSNAQGFHDDFGKWVVADLQG